MAIIWGDDFSAYGTKSYLADGPYANIPGANAQIVNAAGLPGKRCIGGSTGQWALGMVLPSTKVVLGAAIRMRLAQLPAREAWMPVPFHFSTNSNKAIATVCVRPSGSIAIRKGTADGPIIGETDGPVVTAGSWPHLECKFRPGVVGDMGFFELRVNGRTVLDIPELETSANLIGRVFFGWEDRDLVNDNLEVYYTDFVVWDTSDTDNNDFIGQASVFWRKPQSTLAAGGWTSNAGDTVDKTVAKPMLGNHLVASGAGPVTTNTVRINNTYYRWTDGSVNAGTPSGTSGSPWLVALGSDTEEAMSNLYAAIGDTGTPGTTYSSSLVAHTTVTPFGLTEEALVVIPSDGVTISMTFSGPGSHVAWQSNTQFTLRVWDNTRVSAGYIPSVKAEGEVAFSGLPTADQTVTIGGETYTFKAAAANAFEVTIGGDASATADNFVSTVTADSSLVKAENDSGTVTVTAISGGIAGNSIALAESADNVTVSGSFLTGGADVSYPDAFEVRLEPLPDDVTSIRAVIPLVRAAKIDGGDGNLQTSFGVSTPSYDQGPDTAITAGFAFWGNPTEPFVSETNPITGGRWTPGEFNLGARLKVKRTL